MINRINGSPNIARMLAEIDQEVRNQKYAQVVGSDSVVTFAATTGNTWDIDHTPTSYIDESKTYLVTYTPANPTDRPPAAFNLVSNRLVTNAPEPWIEANVRTQRVKVTNPNQQQWRMFVDTPYWDGESIRYRLRILALATGAGSITVTPI